MKQIKLGNRLFAFVDDEDFDWLNQWKWGIKKEKQYFYVRRQNIRMHRFIMGVTDRYVVVDHKDHNTLNNQKSNLRICSIAQNSRNRVSVGASKYLGVSWNSLFKKWKSDLKHNGKSYFLGYFKNEIDAALAYNKKANELHGEFANLNIIT